MPESSPDLVIKGLSFWATGRSYPDASSAWDMDMIDCRIVVEARGARVELDGVIGSRDIHWFLNSLAAVYETLSGDATLDGTDIGFWAKVTPAPLGHMTFAVEVTPGFVGQKHEFTFAGDQTDLPSILTQCRRLLDRFPVRIDLPD